MKSIILIVSALTVAAFAQDKPAENAAAVPPAPGEVKVGKYELKSRSSFTLTKDVRPPFWPIGWQRKVIGAATPTTIAKMPEATGPVLQADHFTVTGVFLGSPALATINGRSFAQNEVLPVVCEGRRIPVVLRAVRDGGVTLEYEGNVLFVPLRRQEVPNKVPSNPGLNSPDPSIVIPPSTGVRPK